MNTYLLHVMYMILKVYVINLYSIHLICKGDKVYIDPQPAIYLIYLSYTHTHLSCKISKFTI